MGGLVGRLARAGGGGGERCGTRKQCCVGCWEQSLAQHSYAHWEPRFSSAALAPLCALSTLTAAACRLVAAAVEGLDQVFVLKCHPREGRLQLQQEVQLAGMQLPSSLQADSAGRLWVAGMPSDMRAPAACLGRAKCSGGKQQVSCLAWVSGGQPVRLGQLPCLYQSACLLLR